MDANTEAIIRLAWGQSLELEHGVLAAERDDRVYHPVADDTSLSVIMLGKQTIVTGPSWALAETEMINDDDLSRMSTLLTVTAAHGPRAVGEAVLAYTDDYLSGPELESATVTDDAQAVIDLEQACPPDDVTAVGLSAKAAPFVLIDEEDKPIAGAGFDIWGGIIAQLGVLTAHPVRGQGHGTLIAALATNAALDEGLIPQWRIQTDHPASAAMARTLGYRALGKQTTVLLGEGR